MRRIALLGALWLTTTAGSCATTSGPPAPVVITKTVEVPVTVKCSAKPPAPPAYPFTKAAVAAAKDIDERIKLLLADDILAHQDARDVRALLSGCTGQ
jgi:hypothetical protein